MAQARLELDLRHCFWVLFLGFRVFFGFQTADFP